jgi:selenoprotein W-related protein
LLSAYAEYTHRLSLVPGSGGQFEVDVNGKSIFSKKAQGRYPEITELKQAINALLE